jgi:hypothetical protein
MRHLRAGDHALQQDAHQALAQRRHLAQQVQQAALLLLLLLPPPLLLPACLGAILLAVQRLQQALHLRMHIPPRREAALAESP